MFSGKHCFTGFARHLPWLETASHSIFMPGLAGWPKVAAGKQEKQGIPA